MNAVSQVREIAKRLIAYIEGDDSQAADTAERVALLRACRTFEALDMVIEYCSGLKGERASALRVWIQKYDPKAFTVFDGFGGDEFAADLSNECVRLRESC